MDERFVFDEDELRIDGYVFRLGHDFAWDAWKSSSGDCFLMFKPRAMLEALDRCFSSRPDDSPIRSIFEIGIWDGGSSAYWFEYFHPDKLVAVDFIKREDSDYFRAYVDGRGIADRLKTHWGVDQADAERLWEIVDTEFDGDPLDLVIDDGSHLLEETRTTFETLFPRLRKGGLYVIEDWNWELNPTFREPDHYFATRDGLVGFVADLARVVGSSWMIHSLTIYPGFVAIERGSMPQDLRFDIAELLADLPVKLDPDAPGPE
jgi:hypothetical protein